MDFLTQIDWKLVFITLAAAFIIYNTFQIIRYSLAKKKAEEEIKKIDAKIAAVNKELEKAKQELLEQIKRFTR
jgi:cell division protein FtsL